MPHRFARNPNSMTGMVTVTSIMHHHSPVVWYTNCNKMILYTESDDLAGGFHIVECLPSIKMTLDNSRQYLSLMALPRS